MELLYIWVENYKDIFVEQGFNFSNEYQYSYNNGEISRVRKRNLNKFYSIDKSKSKISSITAIVGENGSGKSMLLKLIAETMFRQPRNMDSNMLNGFLVYLKDDKKITCLKIGCFSNEIKKCEFIAAIKSQEKYEINKLIRHNELEKFNLIYYSNLFNFKDGLLENNITKYDTYFDLSKNERVKQGQSLVLKDINNSIIMPYNNYLFSYCRNLELEKILCFLKYVRTKKITIEDIKFPQSMILKFNYTEYIDIIGTKNRNNQIMKLIGRVVNILNRKNDQISGKSTILFNSILVLVINFIYQENNIEKIKNFIENIDSYDGYKQHYEEKEKNEFIGNLEYRKLTNLVFESVDFFIENDRSKVKKDIKNFFIIINELIEMNKKNKNIELFTNRFGFDNGNNYIDGYEFKIPISIFDNKLISNIFKLKKTSFEIFKMDILVQIDFFDLSSGERSMISLFSVFYEIEQKRIQGEKIAENLIILIDEGETTFHPEWQRKFLYYLLYYFEELFKVEYYKNIQLIFTSNSPFLISDVAKEDIIFLKKNKNNYEYKFGVKQTFGANIHTLLTNSFFMDSTIGEFANQKIKNVVRDLSEKSKEEILNSDGRKKEIEYIIDNIGEPVIKRKLQTMYRKIFPKIIEEYEFQIEDLQKEKAELETKLKNNYINNIDHVMKLLDDRIKELKEKAGDGKGDINKMQQY